MMSKLPQVTVVIPTWNKKEFCLKCLESIKGNTYPQDRIKIIIVDNASSDNTASAVKARFADVQVISLKKNVGFGAAVNKGIKKAKSNYFLILDNDVIVGRRTIAKLINEALKNKDYMVLSGKIYDGHEGRKLQTVFGEINEKTFHVTRFGAGEIDRGNFESVRLADYVSVGASLIKREVFNKVGYFDERYFIYFDDTDFLYRCKNMGIKSVYIPSAEFWHEGSASLGSNNPKILYYLCRNNLLIRSKFRGLSWPEHFGNLKMVLYTSVLYLRSKEKKYSAVFWGIFDFYRKKFEEAPQNL